MITQINSVNKDEYDKLFQDALEDLKKEAGDNAYELNTHIDADTYEAGGVYYIKNEETGKFEPSFAEYDENENYYECRLPAAISTLPEYFYYLGQLGRINTKYLVLPLDEPYFNINANTRKIEIPKEFSTNGISVQGDHGAEIVYFKINRFFDFMDFGSPDANIIIQWETSDKKTGSAIAIYKDITSDPDFLIFGWELDKNITKAGAVKFSIRVLTWKDESKTEYDYSFSTLPATVTILPTLQLEGEFLTPNEDIEANILNRIKDSPAPMFTLKLAPPVFAYPENKKQEQIIELEKNTETGEYEYKLKACAYPNPQGYVRYSWLQNEAQMMTNNNELNSDYVLLENVDNWNENITYYKDENGKKIVYPIKTKEDIVVDDIGQITPTLYYKEGQKVISMAGRYNVIAQSIGGNYGQSEKVKNEYTWIVPGPEELRLSSEEDEIIAFHNDELNNYIFNINNIQENIENYLDYHKFNTVWKLNENILDEYQNKTTVEIKINKDASIETQRNSQGKYTVAMKGIKNNAETEEAVTKTYIILLPPQDFSATLIANDTNANVENTYLKNDTEFKVATTLNTEDGSSYQLPEYTDVSYEWHFNTQGASAINAILENIEYTSDEKTQMIDDLLNTYTNHKIIARSSTYMPSESGYYCCKVYNKYGNNEQASYTLVYTVM